MIEGRNILIYEDDVVVAAAKSCTINNNAEALENSSPASGTARSYTVGRTGWDISISTLVLGMKDHLLKVGQAYRMVWKERGNDSDTMQGTAICTNAQVAATVGNLAQGSFQFLGSDDNGTIVTPPTPTPSDYVTEQDVVNIINQYNFTTEQWVQNYAGIANGVITIGNNSITPLTANSSLAWGKLTGKPTTLSGYGITDAKIANGVITLGSSTITPVTSVAMSVPTGFSVTGSPITKTGTLALSYASGYEGFTTALKNKIEEIYSWFEADANGDIKTKDTAGGHVRGFYTESFVSALGANSSGGGGGDFDEAQMWAALQSTSGTYATTKIATSHIPDMASTYGYVKSSGVTSVATGTGLTGGTITSTGTISINSTYQTYISNGNTAYGWGNHATAGYASASSVTTLQGYFTNGVANTAAKLNTGTTTYTAWGQTYWSSGVPQSISGNMTSVGSITPSANGNALGTTSARFNIYGTSGNFSGNVSIGGTLGVTGATTLSSTLSVASGITLTTTKKIYFGDTDHYLELNSTGFHFSHGVYSDSFVSALGANSSGGGGGGIDLDAMWAELQGNTGTYANAKINVNHIPDISSTYGYAKTSQLGSYLPLTGGTITLASIDGLTINKSNNSAGMIRFTNGSTLLGYLGYYGAGVPACNIGGNYRALLHTDNFGNYAYALYGGTNLSPSESNVVNLNTITDYGSYYCATIASASYVQNQPTGATAFRLWVSCPLGTSSVYIRQRYQGYAQIQAFERYSNNGGSTWSAWYRCQADVDGEFLPLTGGTLTGSLTVNNNSVTALGYNIKFDVDTSREIGLVWLNTSGTRVASVTYHNTPKNIIINPIGSTDTWSDAVGKYSLIVGNNKLTYNTYTILHSNNTYVSSGKGYINGTEITTISGNAASASYLSYSHTNEINFKGGMQETCYFNFRNADSDSSDGGTTAINYKFCNYTRETAYSTVTAGTFVGAFSGNATTATTLQTSRTIWGESFNGSADVSGAMTGVTSITMSSHIIMNNNTSVYIKDINGTALRMLTVNNSNQYFLGFDAKQNGYNGYIDANNLYLRCTTALYLQTSLVTLNAGARISKGGASGSILYIGDSNNSGWVCVQDMCSQTGTGDTYWSIRNGGNAIFKECTATSDERKKNILGDTTFSVKDIADTRSILFEWKDNTGLEKKVHGGSIAQDWLGKADWALTLGDDGYYSLNYGALALCSAITIAREVVKHEDEITRLKKEVVKLRERVAELEERRA